MCAGDLFEMFIRNFRSPFFYQFVENALHYTFLMPRKLFSFIFPGMKRTCYLRLHHWCVIFALPYCIAVNLCGRWYLFLLHHRVRVCHTAAKPRMCLPELLAHGNKNMIYHSPRKNCATFGVISAARWSSSSSVRFPVGWGIARNL